MNDPDNPLQEETAARMARVCRYSQIGRCVNSVTHDVNNYLGAIMAYSELVSLDAGVSDDSQRMLREIMGAVRKSSSLIGNLTDLARRERQDVRVIDPSVLAERVLDLRRYELKVGHIHLDTTYSNGVKPFSVDLPTTELALLYLISNAIEAVESLEDKRVRLAIRNEDECVVFVVSDSADIIPDDIAARMYEPGYTTKSGPHLGMGLYTARAVARARWRTRLSTRRRFPSADPCQDAF